MPEEELQLFPVQTPGRYDRKGRISRGPYMKAYEVYSYVYAPQTAMIIDGCRGGFSTGELIAFLYAASFPKAEWKSRVDEAFKGMSDL